MQKAAKGETVEGHKYLERHPDGKGGWLYRYLAGHEIEITPHEKLGMRGTLKWKVFDSDDTHASVGFHATVPGYGHKISHDALAMYKDDLEGRVVSDKPSGDLDIDAVTSGKAEFLGKGDDGLVFRSGDNVVKVSTVVPYQPSNPWYKTAQKAVEVAREQHETQQALRGIGVPGLLPERFVEHDGRGYTIKRYVEIPDKLTLDQLDAAHDTVLAMHKAGYVLGDAPQVGVDEDGKAVMFDVGKAGKAEPYDGYRHLSPQQSDLNALEHLYSTNGQRYTPRGANLEYEWDARLQYALKFPPKVDAARDSLARELINMSHALRKDADEFGRLVIDQDLAEALKKLERPEQVDVAKLLEAAPAAVHAELPHAAARAVKAGARAGTLELLGAGAEGIVFTDGSSAYKVGRGIVTSRKNEADALEVLSKDPRTKDLVPHFEKYDADSDTIVRAEVAGRDGGWGSKGLWEAHQTIAKVLREHQFTAPEFKENSFVVTADGKPKLVDVGYVQPIGLRAAAALDTKIKGLRAIDFQIDPGLASDLSLDLFATYDEGAMSLDTLRAHVAKVKELAPDRKFSDLQFADRLKARASADISPLHIDAVKSVLKEYASEFHTIGLRIVDDDPPEVGSILAESRRWEDGEPTDDILDGTSAIDLARDGSDVSRALDHAKGYRGKYALLLGSQSSEEGEDTDRFGRPIERVMRKPEVLARFKLKKSEGSERPGHKYIRREPDGKGGHNYFYEDSKGVRTPATKNTYSVTPDLGMTPAHKKKIAALAASMKGISHTGDAFADHEEESHVRNAWRNEWMTKTTPQLALIGKIARGRASADEKRAFAEAVTRASRISKKEIDDCAAMAVRQYAATQALFAANDERTVRVHRGIAHEQGKALLEQAKRGGTVPVAVRSLSSWTSDEESGHDFGTQYATRGAVVTLDVPVEAVLFHAEHEADLGAYEGEEETLVMSRDDLQVPAAAIQEAQGELGDPDPDAFARHRISVPHETEKVEAEREARREADKKSAKAAEKQKQAEWEAGAPAREAAAQAEREAAQAKRAEQDKAAAERQQKLEVEQYHASKLPKAEREKMAKELLTKPGLIPSIGALTRDWRMWLGVDMKGNATRDDGAAPDMHPDTYAAVKARAGGVTKAWASTGWVAEDLLKGAKGEERPGHKYTSRKPDGKGGWLYEYGDAALAEKPLAYNPDAKIDDAAVARIEASVPAHVYGDENMSHISGDASRTARAAIRFGADAEKLHFLGAGAEGMVLSDGARVYKRGDTRLAREAEIHALLEADPRTKDLVSRFEAYEPKERVLVRGLVRGKSGEELPGRVPEMRRAHARITEVLNEHGFYGLEFQDRDFLIDESTDKPKAIDLGNALEAPQRRLPQLHADSARIEALPADTKRLPAGLADFPYTVVDLFRRGVLSEADADKAFTQASRVEAFNKPPAHLAGLGGPSLLEAAQASYNKHRASLTPSGVKEASAKIEEALSEKANNRQLADHAELPYFLYRNGKLAAREFVEISQRFQARLAQGPEHVNRSPIQLLGMRIREAEKSMSKSVRVVSWGEAIRKARTKGWASPEHSGVDWLQSDVHEKDQAELLKRARALRASEQARKSQLFTLRKASEGSEGERSGHKYIRRTPDGKGGWRYGYDLPGHPSDRPPRKPAGEVRLTRPQLDDLLEHGTYSIISAGRNGNDSREKDMPEDHAEFKARHERLRGELKKRKLRYTEVEGHYGSKEASFIVHHESAKPQKSNAFMVHHDSPSEFGVMRALGKQFNQDSVIHSHHGAHEMHFTTGGHAGEHHKGKGYEYKPAAEDFYTRVETPGRPSKFALEFDWDKHHAFHDAVLKALLVFQKAAKGEEQAGHRYVERHPDGKGGWHYVYGAYNRPIGAFTVPKGFTSIGKHPDFRHGTVTYAEPLPKADQRSYELTPIASTEGRKQAIAHAIDKIAEYRDEYADLVSEPGGRRMIEPAIRQAFQDFGAHIERSDDAITEVIDSLSAPLEKSRKLHRRRDFRGLQVSVENQSGSIRHWYDSHAKRAGKTKMTHDYGYIRRTQGTDGDHVDVYVGPDKMAPYVFVIDQLKSPDFVHVDEQKCMLGFSNLGAAVQAYHAHYDDPRFLGQVRAVAFEDFAAFVTDPSNHGALVKSYVVQRYSPSQEPPDFEGIYGTVQTEKEVKASRRRRKALARRNSGKYAFHGAAPEKPSVRFRVREWATLRDAVETGKR